MTERGAGAELRGESVLSVWRRKKEVNEECITNVSGLEHSVEKGSGHRFPGRKGRRREKELGEGVKGGDGHLGGSGKGGKNKPRVWKVLGEKKEF